MKTLLTIIFFNFISAICISQTTISKQQAIEDIDFYISTLQDVHYNPFLFKDEETFMAEAEVIKLGLSDPITKSSLILSLHQLSALMKDSHSAPSMFQEGIFAEEYKKPQFFPIKVFVEDHRLYVPPGGNEKSPIPIGSEILSINGIKMSNFLKGIQPYTAGIEAYSEEMTGRLLSHYLFLSGVKAPFAIEYVASPGIKDLKMLEEGIPYVNALVLSMPALVKGNSFDILEHNVGYIDFANMNQSPNDAIEFMETAFKAFKERNVQYLAVDLRNNSGGNSVIGEILFGYIANKQFFMQGGKLWKISNQYKEYLLANGRDKEEYLNKENGTIWEINTCNPRDGLLNVDDKFTGKVYMLTGPFTFSSGNMVADTAKQFNIAEIVGEPTGELTTDFGEVYSFSLPHSGILMNSTTSFDIGANCDSESLSSVMPDFYLPVSLEDKLAGKDRVLEYIIEKAKQ